MLMYLFFDWFISFLLSVTGKNIPSGRSYKNILIGTPVYSTDTQGTEEKSHLNTGPFMHKRCFWDLLKCPLYTGFLFNRGIHSKKGYTV